MALRYAIDETVSAEELRPVGDAFLTPRDIELLALLASGQSNKQIAAAMGVSESTVKSHLSALFRKLGVADRTQAALRAISLGVVQHR